MAARTTPRVRKDVTAPKPPLSMGTIELLRQTLPLAQSQFSLNPAPDAQNGLAAAKEIIARTELAYHELDLCEQLLLADAGPSRPAEEEA